MSYKNLGGRPPFTPTPTQRRQVEVLVAHGNAEWLIAKVVGCDRKTLRRHFRAELTDGRDMLVARMGLAIVRAALSGRPESWRAAAYWLAIHCPEWRVAKRVAVSGTVAVTDRRRDIEKMTDAEIQDALAKIDSERAAVAGSTLH